MATAPSAGKAGVGGKGRWGRERGRGGAAKREGGRKREINMGRHAAPPEWGEVMAKELTR